MSSIQKFLEKTKKLWKTHSPCFALTLKRNSTDRKANTKRPKHFFAIIAEQLKKTRVSVTNSQFSFWNLQLNQNLFCSKRKLLLFSTNFMLRIQMCVYFLVLVHACFQTVQMHIGTDRSLPQIVYIRRMLILVDVAHPYIGGLKKCAYSMRRGRSLVQMHLQQNKNKLCRYTTYKRIFQLQELCFSQSRIYPQCTETQRPAY